MAFTFLGYHDPLDGYGYATINLAQELKRLRPDVTIVDMRANEEEEPREWRAEGTALALCTPDWLPNIHADRIVIHTMFEADKLPPGWVEKINTYAARVVVPCDWCRRIFALDGVRVPIDIAPWGINFSDYYYLDRSDHLNRPYTFLWSGTPDLRKGWDIAYRAFDRAFRGNRDVRLRLHFRDPMPLTMRFTDPNVEMALGHYDRPALRAMLQQADCFIFPSRGEGWGLPPREAAATGLPVIATDYGGLSVEIEHWAIPIGVVGTSPAGYGWWPNGIGEWVEPSLVQLAAEMRRCYEECSDMALFGQLCALWLRSNTPWERTARALLDAVRKVEES